MKLRYVSPRGLFVVELIDASNEVVKSLACDPRDQAAIDECCRLALGWL